MKILYCGVYRDGTGWGKAAEGYILSLDAAGMDVVPRPIKLNNIQHKPHSRIVELESKPSEGCDVVIQHILPHMMSYNGRLLNIGLFASETSQFTSSWADRLNFMDEVWTINYQQVAACKKSGVNRKPKVIPHALDVEKFQQSYSPLDILKPYKDDGEFIFYTVGEYVRRKNMMALVKAFHLEFDPSEPVRLVIKTNRPDMSPAQTKQVVMEDIRGVKEGLKLNGGYYKSEIIITDRLSEQGMYRLHAAGDVFVLPSCGEAWALPAMDAMAMGRTPIVTGCTGFLDYVSNKEGWLVKSHLEPCFGVTDSFADLYTGNELWHSIDIPHLRACMREAFQDRPKRKEKAVCGIKRAYDFSYENIGNVMRKAIYERLEGGT